MLFATISWGMAFIWIKQITETGMDTNAFVAIRYGIAALLMTPFCIKELRRITRRELMYGGIIGGLMYVAILFQTYGLMYTTPANSGFITTAYVVFVPFTTWIIMKKKPSLGVMASIALCLGGIYVLTMGGESLEANLGNLMTLGCALCWSVQVAILSKAARECGIKVLTIVPIYLMLIFSAVAALVGGGFDFGGVDVRAAMTPIVLCALFPTLLAGVAQAYAQRFIDPSKAAIIYTLESVFACIASIMLGMEKMTPNLAAGGAMVIGAIVLNEFFARKKEKKEAAANEEG